MNMNKKWYRINEDIDHKEVRITGKDIDSQVVSIEYALDKAIELDVDLIEIVPNANPPVCKLIRMDKFLYELKQKEKSQSKSSVKIKEIRLSYNMGEHDFNFKLKHAINFLEDKNKVKLTIFFSGRQIQYKEKGEYQIISFIDKLDDVGKVESMPKLDGKKLWCIVSPKK